MTSYGPRREPDGSGTGLSIQHPNDCVTPLQFCCWAGARFTDRPVPAQSVILTGTRLQPRGQMPQNMIVLRVRAMHAASPGRAWTGRSSPARLWYACCSPSPRAVPRRPLHQERRRNPFGDSRRVPARAPEVGRARRGDDVNEELNQPDGSARRSSAPYVAGSSEAPVDNLAIFSLSAVELVNEWWRESNRRWAENKPLTCGTRL
jgi:hypothetical protein